jgi:beta-glucosidase
MVLLKNEGALPIDAKAGATRLALYGYTSYDFIAGGTGSGNVNHAYVVSLPDGLKNAGFQIDENLAKAFTHYLDTYKAAEKARIEEAMKKDKKAAMLAMFLPKDRLAEMTIAPQQMAQQAQEADMAVITIGRISGEFLDRKRSDFNLSKEEQTLISQVCETYHKVGKKVVVLLNIGGVIETATWKHLPDAILCAWQAGQEAATR